MQRTRWIAAGILSAVSVALAYALVSAPAGPRSLRDFEPDRLADLELRMWQAYYAKENVRLFGLLVTTLREQYHYSWLTATKEGYHLARAAATFGNARSDYEQVLPDLEAGYLTAKNWLHAGFDPRAVADAELAWWVARRTPGADSAPQVGSVMADAYALLYEVPRPAVMRAALLRAQAAKLRDIQAKNPDWQTIGTMLEESYRDLRASLAEAPGAAHASRID